jgi:hypothetical protein
MHTNACNRCNSMKQTARQCSWICKYMTTLSLSSGRFGSTKHFSTCRIYRRRERQFQAFFSACRLEDILHLCYEVCRVPSLWPCNARASVTDRVSTGSMPEDSDDRCVCLSMKQTLDFGCRRQYSIMLHTLRQSFCSGCGLLAASAAPTPFSGFTFEHPL